MDARRRNGIDNGIKPGKMAFMNTMVTIDAAGRIIIPKAIRDALRLASGDMLSLESDGESVTLRTMRPEAPLKKERGIWVFRSGRKMLAEETNRALEEVRSGRDHGARRSSD